MGEGAEDVPKAKVGFAGSAPSGLLAFTVLPPWPNANGLDMVDTGGINGFEDPPKANGAAGLVSADDVKMPVAVVAAARGVALVVIAPNLNGAAAESAGLFSILPNWKAGAAGFSASGFWPNTKLDEETGAAFCEESLLGLAPNLKEEAVTELYEGGGGRPPSLLFSWATLPNTKPAALLESED